jgi:hypothetical protein
VCVLTQAVDLPHLHVEIAYLMIAKVCQLDVPETWLEVQFDRFTLGLQRRWLELALR